MSPRKGVGRITCGAEFVYRAPSRAWKTNHLPKLYRNQIGGMYMDHHPVDAGKLVGRIYAVPEIALSGREACVCKEVAVGW